MKHKRETLTFKAPKPRDPMARELSDCKFHQRIERPKNEYRRMRSNDKYRLMDQAFED